MAQQHDVYLFGQILGTHSFLLRDGFLQPDEYAEIKDQYFLPGGETGTAATVLDSLGVSVKMDGTWIGTEVAPMLKAFYADKQVDLSSMCFTEDPGVMDYVVWFGLPWAGSRRCFPRENAGGTFRRKKISQAAKQRQWIPISGMNPCWQLNSAGGTAYPL